MSSLKIRQADGTFRDILMIKGDKGDAGVATEAINDALIDTEHTWSSSKIEEKLTTKANDIDLEIETVTADITIASLMQKVEVGKSKKFQYTNESGTDLPSDYPSIMLNAKAIFRPTITVNRITAGIMYLEIISPNQSTGVPKTMTGYYNGTFYWNEELSMTNVANNLITNQDGYVLDARQGKILSNRIEDINNNLPYCFSIYISPTAANTFTNKLIACSDDIFNNYTPIAQIAGVNTTWSFSIAYLFATKKIEDGIKYIEIGLNASAVQQYTVSIALIKNKGLT